MGRTQVAICLFCFFASACEAADCSNFTDACPGSDPVKRPSDEQVHSAGSSACCGKTCKAAFTGKCAATQVAADKTVYYGSQLTDMNCCMTTCASAKKITCPSGKSMKEGGRKECLVDGHVDARDACDKEERCCETTTCVHTTCDTVAGGFDANCKPNCQKELKDLKAESVNAAATCVSTKGLDKTGCYNCIKCYDGLHFGGKMTVGPPVKGAVPALVTSTGNVEIKMTKAHADALTATPAKAKLAFASAIAKTIGVPAGDVTVTAIYIDGVVVSGRRLADSVVKVEWTAKAKTVVVAATIDTATLKTNIQTEAKAVASVDIVVTEAPTMTAKEAVGSASRAWSSRCLASALLVGGGLFGMTA